MIKSNKILYEMIYLQYGTMSVINKDMHVDRVVTNMQNLPEISRFFISMANFIATIDRSNKKRFLLFFMSLPLVNNLFLGIKVLIRISVESNQ